MRTAAGRWRCVCERSRARARGYVRACGVVKQPYLRARALASAPQKAELTRALTAARAHGKHVRAIAVINPGNPTGNCLGESNMRDVLAFAAENQLVVLADEVYQDNIWDESKGEAFARLA